MDTERSARPQKKNANSAKRNPFKFSNKTERSEESNY